MQQALKYQLNSNHQDNDNEQQGDLALETAKPALKKPSMYAVIMFNDDYTPMEFVVEVLQGYFAKTLEQATQIMLTVHTKGKAVCAIYTHDIAETKAAMVNQYARDNQHPLVCEIAPTED